MSDAQIDEAITQVGDQGIALTGGDGLLPELVKTVLDRDLGAQLDDRLGSERVHRQSDPIYLTRNHRISGCQQA